MALAAAPPLAASLRPCSAPHRRPFTSTRAIRRQGLPALVPTQHASLHHSTWQRHGRRDRTLVPASSRSDEAGPAASPGSSGSSPGGGSASPAQVSDTSLPGGSASAPAPGQEPAWLTALRVGGDATASAAAAGLAPAPAHAAAAATVGGGGGGGRTLLGALAAFFRVLGDTLRILLRLAVVEPLSWVLNRSGLLAIRAADLVQQLEQANATAPLDADRLAGALRVLNKHAPEATVDFVETRCLDGSGSVHGVAAPSFAVNSAVVREYLAALVKTGRLAQYGDSPTATPGQGQSHRSLPQLLAELQAAAGGEALHAEPGASLARPLHVIVQAQEKAGGVLSWLSSFLWSCLGLMAVMYVVTAGAAAVRRFQGGSSLQAGLPGASSSVAAAPGGASMFAAKEYSKENLPEKSVKRFRDVKGCDEAIAELQEVVEYLKCPDKFTRLGGKLPKGVLLTGPPGTGKTLLARAVAGEAGVPFFYKAGSEFDEMFVGVGSRRVRSLFAAAKKKAPCIIFIDEIDAMGGKRTNWEASGGSRKTLNQLLTDMDGFEENSGVVVMAATNLPELLDSALTRPGRFDRQVAVGLPDVRGRQHILDLYLEGKPVAPDVDSELLARRTPGFSGAELANLVNEAALLAARHDCDHITTQLLDEARDKVLMGAPRAITQSEEARRLTAYHEGGHALVALYTPGAKPIHKATIVPRGQALGMVSQVPDKDEYSTTRQQLRAHIDVCMGGKAAEELVFGEDHVTSGATSDLRQATRIARHMVAECGMSDRIGPVAVGEDQSPSTRQAVDAEVQEMLKRAYQRVAGLLREKESELHTLANALLQSETLTQAEIRSLLLAHSSAGMPGGPASGSGSSSGSGGIPQPALQPAASGVTGGEAGLPAPAPAAAVTVGDAAAARAAPSAAEGIVK